MYLHEFTNQYSDDGESETILVDLNEIYAVERHAEYCTIHIHRNSWSVRIAYPELKKLLTSIHKIKHGLE